MPKGRPVGVKDSKPRHRRWYKAPLVTNSDPLPDAKSSASEESKAV